MFDEEQEPALCSLTGEVFTMDEDRNGPGEEAAIRNMVEDWASAVRERNLPAVLRHHSPDILMFDVPPPFQSRGLNAYMETWKIFYQSQARPITFYFEHIEVTAAEDVAFTTAIGTCGYIEHGVKTDLKFRLTKAGRSESRDPKTHFAEVIQHRADRVNEC